MKHPHFILILLSFALLFAAPSQACENHKCCEPASAAINTTANLMADGITAATGALTESVKFTTHISCEVIREAPRQVAALPDHVATASDTAEQTGNTLAERLLNGAQAVISAFISISASLLRIVFSSFSALASAISPF